MFVFLSGTIENYWNVWRVAGKTALGLTFARRFIRSSIEYWSRVGNQFDDVVSKRRIRKGFAQPVEFLDLSFPRERVPETTFVVGLLAIKDFPSLGPDGDAGAEFARISCREDFVRVDLDFAQQRLRVAGPDTRWLELRRSDRIVQKCRSDQIFQIVVRLLFGPGSVLGTEGAATGDVEAGLKDITQDALDVVCRQAVVAFELENGFQHGLTMDERTVLLQDSLFDDFQGIVGPIDIDLLVKHPLQPVRAFEQPRWSGEAALGERCRINRAHARHPR